MYDCNKPILTLLAEGCSEVANRRICGFAASAFGWSDKMGATDMREEGEEIESAKREAYMVAHCGRSKLETDILCAATARDVHDVLQAYAILLASHNRGTRLSSIAAAAGNPIELQEELSRGLKAIVKASCDKRLETFHWMVTRLQRDGTAAEIVECFFKEAECQKSEAEGEEKETIEAVFGV